MIFQQKTGCSILLLWLISGGLTAQSVHRTLRQGDTNYDKGDYTAAQSAYQKAANNIGRYNAGNAAMQQNQLQEAVDFYSAAAEKSTSATIKADALYNLGNAYLQQKKYSAAIKAYESSLRVAPNRPDAQKNLQIAKRQLQEPPPPPPSPPPPPPPPSTRPPRKSYLDQAEQTRQKEIPPSNIPPEIARQMLQKAVLPEEQQNARAYRELSPANRPSRLKKDW
jgi:tetratricopeptide (TPR) repeat protein